MSSHLHTQEEQREGCGVTKVKQVWEEDEGGAAYVLDSGGDVQPSDAWSGELSGVDVGDFPHSSVYVFQILSLHHQDGLRRVKVELQRRLN